MWIKLLYFMRIYKQTGRSYWLLRISCRLSCENHYRLYIWYESLPLHLPNCDRRLQWGLHPHCRGLRWYWRRWKVPRKELCLGICLNFRFGNRWYPCRRLWWQCCTGRGLDLFLPCTSHCECGDAKLARCDHFQVFLGHQRQLGECYVPRASLYNIWECLPYSLVP